MAHPSLLSGNTSNTSRLPTNVKGKDGFVVGAFDVGLKVEIYHATTQKLLTLQAARQSVVKVLDLSLFSVLDA